MEVGKIKLHEYKPEDVKRRLICTEIEDILETLEDEPEETRSRLETLLKYIKK